MMGIEWLGALGLGVIDLAYIHGVFMIYSAPSCIFIFVVCGV